MNKNRYLIELDEGGRTEFGRVGFEDQTEPWKTFSAIWELESQVNNGGFDQFFRNCETGVILHAPVALETIGALMCSEIVKQAIAMIAPLPPTREARASALDALAEDRQALLTTRDEEFFAYPDDLTELLFDYVSKHPESFGPAPRCDPT